ncbi:MAG TPA: hypothetical protein VKG92_10530, partial [Flavobacteriales bacterium]|nr:hypothetical protein [Flavobacteriales bacterium]
MKNALIGHQAVALVLVLSFFLPSCAAQQGEHANKYEQYLSEAYARGQFNGTALIFDGGRVVYQGAFGIR